LIKKVKKVEILAIIIVALGISQIQIMYALAEILIEEIEGA
jgi:hypothetical protein